MDLWRADAAHGNSRQVDARRDCDHRLEELIGSGEWPVGFRVPPEPELVRALGVSRNTVREAVRALVHVGMLDPRPGDGTYVRADTGPDAALERAARR